MSVDDDDGFEVLLTKIYASVCLLVSHDDIDLNNDNVYRTLKPHHIVFYHYIR